MVQNPGTRGYGFADLDFIGTWASGIFSQPVAPVLSPPGGQYDFPTVVRMSCITTSATIYYTTDGSTPTSASAPYTGPIVVSANTQINAVAIDIQLSTPSSRITTWFFFVPSVLYAHAFRYDDRGYQLNGAADCIFRDPVSGWWYNYLLVQDAPGFEIGRAHV